MLKQVIGSRIQILRIRSGLTQVELAKRASIHRSYLASVESGERNISLDSLDKIIEALNHNYQDFFSRLE